MLDREELITDRSTGTSGTVFVSYASHDAAIAQALVTALERQNIGCWIAPRDVAPGSQYADQIIGAINNAKLLVLVLSKDAVASPHVSREIERASSKRRPIITVRTDAVVLTPSFEYFLSESQWIDVVADGRPKAFEKATAAIQHRLAGPVDSAPFAKGNEPDRSRPTGSALNWRAIAAALTILCAVFTWVGLIHTRPVMRRESAVSAPVASTHPDVPVFSPPAHSIAVLPFVNLSGDPKQDFFSDGISEELLNSLSRLSGLLVVARTSSFNFRGKDADVTTIAHSLNVGAVLEGSVRRAGNTVRITVQLINAVNGFHLWSEEYDRKWIDMLQIQSEVAKSVAQQLKGKLTTEDEKKIELGGTDNQAAYEAELRGIRISRSADNEKEFRAALAEFDHAIALDSKYAEAYVGRAFQLLDIANFAEDDSSRPILRKEALAAARRAVALSPNYGRAHEILAVYFETVAADFVAALAEYETALRLSPGVAGAHSNLSTLYLKIGRLAEAETEARQAVSLDPQNYLSHVMLAVSLYSARRYSDALTSLHQAEAVKPLSSDINRWLVNVMLSSGENHQALQSCESSAFPLEEAMRHYCLAITYFRLGRREDATHEFEELRKQAADYWAVQYAEIFAQWGDKRMALYWLNKADKLGGESMQYIRVDPLLDPIRGDLEYKAIEARQKLPL